LNTSGKDEILKNVSVGSYTGEITDKDGCKARGNYSVLQPPKLKIDNIKTNSQNCAAPINGIIAIVASGGTVTSTQSYQYAIDTVIGYSLINTFSNMKLGRYTITVRDINRCKFDTIFDFVNSQKIEVSLPPIQNLALGETIQLIPNFSYGVRTSFNDIKSVLWTPSIGLSCTDCIQPIASPFKSTTYNLTVLYGAEDCQSEATTSIVVANAVDLYIPNSFTPNSDRINDVWMVYGKNVLDIKISIYDKTGELMYRADEMKSGWNGLYKGEPCKIDAYTYIIKTTYIDGSTQQYTGILNLLR
jgi:gliding motility-associated-like protein